MLKTLLQITFITAALTLLSFSFYETFTWRHAVALVSIFVIVNLLIWVWGSLSPVQQRYMHGRGGLWSAAFVVFTVVAIGIIKALT